DIICTVNIQHDCSSSDCNSTSTIPEKQERLLTSRTKDFVKHACTNAYVVNTSAIHNHQWIKAVIPPVLYN
ncbi:hypothetical protein OG21DRAFT_1395790, partial [Imleria badia]